MQLPSEPVGPVGVICSSTRFDEAHRAAAAAGARVVWMETSLERAMPVLHSASSVLVEWTGNPKATQSALMALLGNARRPLFIIVGSPDRRDLFKLAKAGIDEYFEGFGAEAFYRAVASPSGAAEALLRQAARTNLGRLGVKEAQKIVRVEMFREALLSEKGNRHAAARVLKVDRRYVSKMANERDRPKRPASSKGKVASQCDDVEVVGPNPDVGSP